MTHDDLSRRSFLIRSCAGISSAWLMANWPEILDAHDHAHRAATSNQPVKFQFFSTAQAAEIEAVAAQIIPSDDTPGAREARVIYFIDRALTTFDRDKQKLYTKGLTDLQSKTRKQFPAAKRFSALTAEQQIELLKSIEKTDFFGTVRTHTIMGFLANPEYGGNHDGIGWKTVGFEDTFSYQPPFGFYDGETAKGVQ